MRSIGCILLFMSLCAGFTSCQKELALTNPTTDSTSSGGGSIPPSTNGDLLIKAYGKAVGSSDTNVTVYSYDAAKKLIAMRSTTSLSGGSNVWNGYERNAAGLITRRKQYAISGSIPVQGDTAVFDYYYSNGTNPQILYSISVIGIAGFSTTDSVVYTYNAGGKLTKSDHFTANFITGLYQETMLNAFNYDGSGNCNKIEQFLPTNGTLSSQQIITITYDNRTSPYNYTEAESVVIAETPASIHNLLSSKQVTTIAGTITITNTLNYNSASKPATGRVVQDYNGITTTNFTYYYQ